MRSNSERHRDPVAGNEGEPDPRVTLEIVRAIQEMRFGSVEIVVHEGRVVQIERKEKIRFSPAATPKGR